MASAAVNFANYDDDTHLIYKLAEISAYDHFGTSFSNGFGDLAFKTNSTGTTSDDISIQMILDYSGNVGIGTNHPQEKLHVVGCITACNAVFPEATVSNLVASNATITSITSSNIATSNLIATNATILNFSISNVVLDALSNLTASNATITYFNSCNISTSNIYNQQDIVCKGNVYANNLSACNFALTSFVSPVRCSNTVYTRLYTYSGDLTTPFSNVTKTLGFNGYIMPAKGDDTSSPNFNYTVRVFDADHNTTYGSITL